MQRLIDALRGLTLRQSGATAVEYAVVISLLAIGTISAIQATQDSISDQYDEGATVYYDDFDAPVVSGGGPTSSVAPTTTSTSVAPTTTTTAPCTVSGLTLNPSTVGRNGPNLSSTVAISFSTSGSCGTLTARITTPGGASHTDACQSGCTEPKNHANWTSGNAPVEILNNGSSAASATLTVS